MTNLIGIHLQEPVDNWTQPLAKMEAGTPVVCFQTENCTEVKKHNRDLITIKRHFIAHQDRYLYASDKSQAAREFFNQFVDGTFEQHAENIDMICELNEYFGGESEEERKHKIEWAWRVAGVWATEYRTRPEYEHIRLVLARTAVGNDIPVEVAAAAAEYDCLLAYHPYIPVKGGEVYAPEINWEYFSGRWAQMDKAYVKAGVYIDWIFTECGSAGFNLYNDGNLSLHPNDGWRHSRVHNGHVESYIKALKWWIDGVAQWNAHHQNRAKGGVLFTSNRISGWEDFRLAQPALGQVMSYFARYQPHIQVSIPSPQPIPPDKSLQARLWEAAQANQLVRLNRKAGLQNYATRMGFTSVTSNEFPFTDNDGRSMIGQRFQRLDSDDVMVAYVQYGYGEEYPIFHEIYQPIKD